MAEFASRGVGNAGLTTGIIGSALGVLNGGLGNIFGNNNGCNEDHLVNRYDLEQNAKISKLESDIALRDANDFTNRKIADLFARFNTRINQMDKEQAVINAKVDSGIAVLGSQVASINNTIANLTKTVIPNSSICPGWGDVKVCVEPCDIISKI